MTVFAAFESDGTQVSELAFSEGEVMFASNTAFVFECICEKVATNATVEEMWEGMPSSFLKVSNPITGEWIKNFV